MTSDDVKLDFRGPEWVARRLGIDKNTVYKYLQDGTIPALQLGRKWLVSEAALTEWLHSQAESQTHARREAARSADRTVGRMNTLSPLAREVIRQAHADARRYSHHYLGQEHLLLAMVSQRDCRAARALSEAGVTGERIRREVESRIPPGDTPPPKRVARTPLAKAAMRAGAKLAADAGADAVGTEHLLSGILHTGQGAGYDILTALGVTTESIAGTLEQSTEHNE
ncbi:MAG: Clp protease N-terminal domain-containing protein [Phycisphaerae bacterium]|jgi:excisionase family DNA binding protein|nr:Clp protease N-terminal domain-containing protein [Phycisphaerae bacterium]